VFKILHTHVHFLKRRVGSSGRFGNDLGTIWEGFVRRLGNPARANVFFTAKNRRGVDPLHGGGRF
jgi:hypothetical protein